MAHLTGLLLSPAFIGLAALALAVVWMLRDESDRTRPLLVIALVVNLFYGWLLQFAMGRESSLVPWKYDYVLARLDGALGLPAASLAPALQHGIRLPLLVVYQLMIPMMIAWFIVARRHGLSGALIMAYVTEMLVGPALYALLPATGPIYAFRGQWLHPPAVEPVTIMLSGMPNAFPSLHLATAMVLVLFAGGRASRSWSLAFLAATALATISTGEHYTIDLVAGLAFGCFAASVGRRKMAGYLFWLALALGWSAAVRWQSGFLIHNPVLLKLLAGITVACAAVAVGLVWRAGPHSAGAKAAQEEAGVSAAGAGTV